MILAAGWTVLISVIAHGVTANPLVKGMAARSAELDRADPALVLRRIPWHESDPVCAVAPAEPGTYRVA